MASSRAAAAIRRRSANSGSTPFFFFRVCRCGGRLDDILAKPSCFHPPWLPEPPWKAPCLRPLCPGEPDATSPRALPVPMALANAAPRDTTELVVEAPPDRLTCSARAMASSRAAAAIRRRSANSGSTPFFFFRVCRCGGRLDDILAKPSCFHPPWLPEPPWKAPCLRPLCPGEPAPESPCRLTSCGGLSTSSQNAAAILRRSSNSGTMPFLRDCRCGALEGRGKLELLNKLRWAGDNDCVNSPALLSSSSLSSIPCKRSISV